MLPALALMRARRSQESGQRARDVLERQVAHLRRLIDDLLDVSRMTEGKVRLAKQRMDIRHAVQDVLSDCAPLVEAHRHKLSVSLPDEPLWVEGDITRLEQVFSNLLTNAVKFMDDGGEIWLDVRAQRTRAVISVSDTGRGIDPGALTRIFDLCV